MFERFTDRSRRVLVLSQEQARLLGHNFIGTEHLLLGLLEEGEGVGAKALESVGVVPDQVRERVLMAVPGSSSPPVGAPPFTAAAKKVLELALRQALQLGHNYIGTEHVLLGLVAEGEGVGAQVLAYLTGDLGRVRDAVMERLSGGAGGPTVTPAEPICSHRPEDLEGALGYRRLQAKAGEDEPTLAVVAVYCLRCGETLAVHPDAPSGSA